MPNKGRSTSTRYEFGCPLRLWQRVRFALPFGNANTKLDNGSCPRTASKKSLNGNVGRVGLLICFLTLTSGCATWKDSSSLESMNSGDPAASLSHSTSSNVVKASSSQVLLDVEFLKLDLEKASVTDRSQLWNWVDESVIDDQQRHQLFENGFRAGLVVDSQGFRKHVRSMTGTKDVVDEFLGSASVASDLQGGSQQIAMRMGRRYELPLREPMEGSHVTMVRVEGQTIGRTLGSPQFLLALQAAELTANNRLRLHVRPEVQFGQMRQQFVGGGSNSGLRIDQRRQSWPMPTLDMEWNVSKDQLIVLTTDAYASPDAMTTHPVASTSLANQMFVGKNSDQREEQLVLLIRVSQIPTSL